MFVVNCIYRLKEIIANMINIYKIDISYTLAWHEKIWALNALRGSPEYSFKLLLEYCHNLMLCNHDIVTHIKTYEGNQFKFFFMALGCFVWAFQQFCHPIICIDIAHLKGRYLKRLFIVIMKDDLGKGFVNCCVCKVWTMAKYVGSKIVVLVRYECGGNHGGS